jgi:uncharacterized membrane protein YtjA (UPF0391 family)
MRTNHLAMAALYASLFTLLLATVCATLGFCGLAPVPIVAQVARILFFVFGGLYLAGTILFGTRNWR